MRTIAETTRELFLLEYDHRGITSLKAAGSQETEFIWQGESFGGVDLRYRKSNGELFYFSGKASAARIGFCDKEGGRNFFCRIEQKGIEEMAIEWSFKPAGESLLYRVSVKNLLQEPVEIVDLAIAFPMNSNFQWGESASRKVIRHSFISGDNSYLFWTRCDGEGPFLVMLPEVGSRLEFFDLEDEKRPAKSLYRAYILAKGASGAAEQKGCKWRQKTGSIVLAPGGRKESGVEYGFRLSLAESYEAVRRVLYEGGLVDVTLVPGMTVARGWEVKVAFKSQRRINRVLPEFPEETDISCTEGASGDDRHIYRIKFNRLGENLLHISCEESFEFVLEFFITEPMETLIKKRGHFLGNSQEKDAEKWYYGLIKEWNMEKEVYLSPDNYDKLRPMRIYEVTCDDPGLCKPSFLAAKNAEYPVQKEVEVLDVYIDKFVWGGLQRSEHEEYAYGIYGIPDWHQNRYSSKRGPDGRIHLWRAYDYPHIVLLYWSMYKVAKNYRHIKTKLKPQVYLERAYRTALALFTLPEEIDEWSALKTGFYNEKVMEEIFNELEETGQQEKAYRLRHWWERKTACFINGDTDIFGSEYPFDTTGFESTHAFAKYAMEKQVPPEGEKQEMDEFRRKASRFMQKEINCNIACRGVLEPAYYHLGSDFRGNNASYTLSYMSQMGGGAILDYALLYAENREEALRLGYASLLSSWALMNSGTTESNYGCWYPGENNDGAAAGGFEPAPCGYTWLDQPHHRGAWYYSCEIDLGFSGYLREAAVVLAEDPVFGWYCFGGSFREESGAFQLRFEDGVRKNLYLAAKDSVLMIKLRNGHFSDKEPAVVKTDLSEIRLHLDRDGCGDKKVFIQGKKGRYEISMNEKTMELYLDRDIDKNSFVADSNCDCFIIKKCT